MRRSRRRARRALAAPRTQLPGDRASDAKKGFASFWDLARPPRGAATTAPVADDGDTLSFLEELARRPCFFACASAAQRTPGCLRAVEARPRRRSDDEPFGAAAARAPPPRAAHRRLGRRLGPHIAPVGARRAEDAVGPSSVCGERRRSSCALPRPTFGEISWILAMPDGRRRTLTSPTVSRTWSRATPWAAARWPSPPRPTKRRRTRPRAPCCAARGRSGADGRRGVAPQRGPARARRGRRLHAALREDNPLGFDRSAWRVVVARDGTWSLEPRTEAAAYFEGLARWRHRRLH